VLTAERLRDIALELPGTEAGTAWGQPVVKVGKKSLYFWNPKYGPVFGMDFDTAISGSNAIRRRFSPRITTATIRAYWPGPTASRRIGCANACAKAGGGTPRRS